jgi:AcrR family transcriptional regulator
MNMTPKPRRSDATKQNILTAARERFAADGYERATIRAIATQAGIDPAMVMRYFGSKEGLFAAAAQFDLRLPDLAPLPPDTLGTTLVGHFLSIWEKDETFLALLRAAVTNQAAVERIQQVFLTQVVPALAAVVPDRASLPTRAGLISTQLLGLALCRYALRIPPVVMLKPKKIIELVGPVVQEYLTGTLA